MRLSDFEAALGQSFGPEFGEILARELSLVRCHNLTARQAISAGYPIRDVWVALCHENNVPHDAWNQATVEKKSSRG